MSSEFFMITPLYSVRLKTVWKDTIYIKFKKTEQAQISWLPCMWIHYLLHMQECKDETESYNYQWIQPSWGGGGTLDLPLLYTALDNGHLFITATFFCRQGGCCGVVHDQLH